MKPNVLVAQGGGPTAVINQSLAGVVSEARRFPGVQQIYGALHGVRGIVDEDLVNLTRETVQNLDMVALTPSAALGSTRDKPDHAYCKEIFRVLQAHEVGCFFYIGGNDSADTVRIVSDEAQKARLREALDSSDVSYTLETYPARHGWVPRDTPVHDPEQAERHFVSLFGLLRATIGAGAD